MREIGDALGAPVDSGLIPNGDVAARTATLPFTVDVTRPENRAHRRVRPRRPRGDAAGRVRGTAALACTHGSLSEVPANALRSGGVLRFIAMHVVRRDYDYARASKIAHWRSLTAAERIRLADDLRRHALLLHPEWPTDEQRASDIECHIRMSERFERAKAAGKR